jgi:hypothetical protein
MKVKFAFGREFKKIMKEKIDKETRKRIAEILGQNPIQPPLSHGRLIIT